MKMRSSWKGKIKALNSEKAMTSSYAPLQNTNPISAVPGAKMADLPGGCSQNQSQNNNVADKSQANTYNAKDLFAEKRTQKLVWRAL